MSLSGDTLEEETPAEHRWRLPRLVRGLVLANIANKLADPDCLITVEPDDVAVEGPWAGEGEGRRHIHANDMFIVKARRLKWGHPDPEYQPYAECYVRPFGSTVRDGRWFEIAVGLGHLVMQPVFGPDDEAREAEEAARAEAARAEAAREQAARAEAARAEAAREQAAREQAAREQAAREQARREEAARAEAEREPTEREARVGLLVLAAATFGVAVVINGLTGNSTIAFLACVAFFGAGLQFGDRFLKR
jgi:hypothetical protein